MKINIFGSIIFTFCCILYAQDAIPENTDKWAQNYIAEVLDGKHHNYKPQHGIVPDSATAIKMAELLLSNIYGVDKIISERPFTAILVGGY